MTERDRLIKLIQSAVDGCAEYWARKIADHLLYNGVIVPPCKVGDTVYIIYNGYVTTAEVLALYIDNVGGMIDLRITTKKETTVGFEKIIDTGNYAFKDIFLNIEDAEKALKESEQE